jgi:hypothetical protein
MNVDYEALSSLFRVQDIEGLIASGAPEDEYEPEVEKIYVELEALPKEEATVTRLVEIFDDVYKQMFGWSDAQMRRRRPDFEDIAEKIIKYFA